LRFIELFAGIGGFRYGLEKANDTIAERTQQGVQQGSKNNPITIKSFLGTKQFTCVYANEWDKYACQIYRKHYGKKELIEGDITRISAESIPDHDFLTAGFPCPSYSTAGKRKGFEDPRGIVFFEICRIAEVKKPALLLLENVKGLLNHDGGNTFRIILYSLSKLGYDCEWEVLNSKNFGVPQNRERVFIIGHLRGTGGQKIFPIGGTNGKGDESDERQTVNCITAGQGKTQNDGTYLINSKFPHQQDYVHNQNGILRTLPSGCHGNAQHYTKTLINNRIRRLTPIECERLQGFPDGWTEGISDSQRYKCLGNAVTTNVITEIGSKLGARTKGKFIND